MGAILPKQFFLLGGEPIAMRTLRRMNEGVEKYLTACLQNVDETVENFLNVNNCVHKLALVLPESYMPLWRELCEKYSFDLSHTVVTGGETRFQSVKNGLGTFPEADIVLVHDGVRPFADDNVIADVIGAAQRYGAAIPVVPVVDSLRRVLDPASDRSVAVDRSDYRAVQTPQGFRGDLLREAYAVPYDPRFTDDASVVEMSGRGTVMLTAGNASNIKITTPTDMAVAEILLKA